MNPRYTPAITLIILFIISIGLSAQRDTTTIGFGDLHPAAMISSSDPSSDPDKALDRSGYLPNASAAVAFLRQATMGYNMTDVNEVMSIGFEDWIDQQFNTPIFYDLSDSVGAIHQYAINGTGNPDLYPNQYYWRTAWYDYHMRSPDLLRQRIAFALSEILVVSEFSDAGYSYGLADYYDRLLQNSFTNYRTLLDDVTYSPTMGTFLTYMRNPKSSGTSFPDENYAREIMQLFTIGLYELNPDGTRKLDGNGEFIPTYDNEDIAEYSKIFTGLAWYGSNSFWGGTSGVESYSNDMIMYNDYHEPGVKNLLNGVSTPDHNPPNGIADIQTALDGLFAHDNVGPFVCYKLIQRLVTSNPSQQYMSDVVAAFNNSDGVRGDMKAVIKAILLHDEARNCSNCDTEFHGKLTEPFIRYMQLNKAIEVTTANGRYRNALYSLNEYFGQRPLAAPSVFNWFPTDYQPIGAVADNDLNAPEFRITNLQSILGYMNYLQHILSRDDIAEEWAIYTNEPEETRNNYYAVMNFGSWTDLTDNNELHILLDEINLIFAAGKVKESTLQTINNTIQEDVPFSQYDTEEDIRDFRVRYAIFLLMTSPDYLITN